jgi:tetratricopeptide (TPR) repeat protein
MPRAATIAERRTPITPRLTSILRALVVGAVLAMTAAHPSAAARQAGPLDDAQWLFYSARYEAAAAATLEPCASGADGLAACELRSAALLFQIKRALGEPTDKEKAWKQCASCPELLAAFQSAIARGQALARARLQAHPDETAALFLLGKLDLNHVWLHLGTLGRKTGWGEYWEARRTLDKVLKQNPGHIRARVARAWIDYIVDTKMPRGTRWLLGGGNKKRGLLAVREAAEMESEFFTRAEARFALWDMQVRERKLQEAIATARSLARDFPDNHELNTFIDTHHRSLPR